MMNILNINKLLSNEELIGKLRSCETLEDFKKALISYGLEFTQEEIKLLYEKISNTVLKDEQLEDISGGNLRTYYGKSDNSNNLLKSVQFNPGGVERPIKL